MSVFNSRIPTVLSRPLKEGNPWRMSESGGAEVDRSVGIASAALAFRGNGKGGMEIAVGTDPSGDTIWESNGEGGIQLKI